jgi:cytochrome c oxidase subunit 2
MNWGVQWMLPAAGSDFARYSDTIYAGLFWLCMAMFAGIAIATVYFPLRYRFKAGRVTPHQTHNTQLEVIWSVAPLILCVVIFFIGLKGYLSYAVAPANSMEIQVTAKQWLWQFEYPDGSRTINDLHLPIGKNAHFVMTSDDVLHDFFVPDMRVKMDIVPGRYTEVWFNPTVLGKHVFTCAEYCGKGHSDMHGVLTVENDAEFANFLETGGTEWEDYFSGKDPTKTPEVWGKLQWERKGCNSCHNLDGTRSKGPSWKGIWGKMEKLNNGTTVLVDEAYVRESMMQPQAKVVEGFEPIMPTFQGLLKPKEIDGLVAFIKSLQ